MISLFELLLVPALPLAESRECVALSNIQSSIAHTRFFLDPLLRSLRTHLRVELGSALPIEKALLIARILQTELPTTAARTGAFEDGLFSHRRVA